MRWKVMFGTLFLLGVSVSISYSKTMFYTEIKAATVTNQLIYSLKELPNKKLVFLSRGDQSTGHFAIGFLDSIGQIVDYTTYNSNEPSFASYQISISPDNKYAIISGTASGSHLIGGWSDPRIISIDLNTKAINWAKNMGPGCFNGFGKAVEVIDNSTAIISYSLLPESFLCNPPRSIIEKVNLNNYNVIYRKTLKRDWLSYWVVYKISKLGNSNMAVLFSNTMLSNPLPPGRLGIAILNSDNGNVVLHRYPKNGLIISGFRNNHILVYQYIGVQVGYMLLTSDTGFLIAGINYNCPPYVVCMPPITDTLDIDTTTFRLVQMHLVKFDKNGNVKWSKIFYSNTFSVQPNGLAEVSDGYIVGALVGHYEFGFYKDEEDAAYSYHKGYYRFYHPAIIKIDKNNGNIIWAYKYIPANDIVNPSQRITFSWFPSFDNIVITYDSGIVVYGFRVRHPIQNPKPHMSLTRLTGNYYNDISFNEQYGWILKTDKNGNTCPSVQKQSLNLVVENYSYTNDNVNFYTENYNFNPPDFNPTQTTGLYYTNNNCYITPVSNNESNNCSSREFKLLNNKIVFNQEREFKIYNLEGKLIYSGKAKEYIIKKDGFYILKINNNTYKILIK
jgi:hypothetical protein